MGDNSQYQSLRLGVEGGGSERLVKEMSDGRIYALADRLQLLRQEIILRRKESKD